MNILRPYLVICPGLLMNLELSKHSFEVSKAKPALTLLEFWEAVYNDLIKKLLTFIIWWLFTRLWCFDFDFGNEIFAIQYEMMHFLHLYFRSLLVLSFELVRLLSEAEFINSDMCIVWFFTLFWLTLEYMLLYFDAIDEFSFKYFDSNSLSLDTSLLIFWGITNSDLFYSKLFITFHWSANDFPKVNMLWRKIDYFLCQKLWLRIILSWFSLTDLSIHHRSFRIEFWRCLCFSFLQHKNKVRKLTFLLMLACISSLTSQSSLIVDILLALTCLV